MKWFRRKKLEAEITIEITIEIEPEPYSQRKLCCPLHKLDYCFESVEGQETYYLPCCLRSYDVSQLIDYNSLIEGGGA